MSTSPRLSAYFSHLNCNFIESADWLVWKEAADSHLENCFTGIPRDEGSNPSPSAIYIG